MIQPLPSRGSRGYTGGVLAGGVSAALFAVGVLHAETVFIVIVYLAAMPLLMAGLGAGVASGATASLTGIAGLCLARHHLDLAVVYAVVYALPVVGLIALALRRVEDSGGKIIWSSEGTLLTAITLYPCMIFLAAAAAAAHHQGGLMDLTKQALTASIGQFKTQTDPDTFALISSALTQLARLLPAILGTGWTFVILLSGAAAQGSLKQQGWNLRPSFEFQNLFIPSWLIFAVAATGVAGTFAPAPYNYIGTNLCAILCMPLSLVGFAVIHALAGLTKAKTAVLIVFYVAISVLMLNPMIAMWTIVLVTGLGVVDQWVNVRQRFAAGWKRGG